MFCCPACSAGAPRALLGQGSAEGVAEPQTRRIPTASCKACDWRCQPWGHRDGLAVSVGQELKTDDARHSRRLRREAARGRCASAVVTAFPERTCSHQSVPLRGPAWQPRPSPVLCHLLENGCWSGFPGDTPSQRVLLSITSGPHLRPASPPGPPSSRAGPPVPRLASACVRPLSPA